MSSNSCLRIGQRLLCDDQIVESLVEYNLFEPLIGQVILDQSLADVPLSNQEIYSALVEGDKLAGDQSAGDKTEAASLDDFLMQWCQQHQVTWDYLHRVVLRELRLEKFKHLWFEPKIISEFLRIKPNLDQVVYSRIQVEDFFLAQELYFQIQEDGADFFELAREYSVEAEQHDESWTEPVALASLPTEISALFQDGQERKVHQPVLVNGLFWVVRLERLYPSRLTKAMRSILLEQLYRKWLQSKIEELIAQPGAVALQPQPSLAPEDLVLSGLDISSAPEGEAPKSEQAPFCGLGLIL
jgi:hypothetical protein